MSQKVVPVYQLHRENLKPPRHLRVAAKRMWQRLLSDYQIDDSAGLSLLEAACASYQRAEDARKIVRREGLTVLDRFNQKKTHPACSVERDARSQMISALRALKLSPEEF